VSTEEILAALGVALTMLNARGLDLFAQFEYLGRRSILASRASLSAAVTTKQQRSTRHFARGLDQGLPALYIFLMLTGGKLAGDLDSADDRRWVLLLVAPGFLEDMITGKHHRSYDFHAIST